METLVDLKCLVEVSWINKESGEKEVAFKEGTTYQFTKMKGSEWYHSVNELGRCHYFDFEGEDGICNWFEVYK